ncbi:MAG: D-Ala-D-Ala carboxypeptidase family metallohydrolase [Psychrobacter sp.]|nr:D-Ala-D-Ala carboxypeptidase family metallohydrolase [Psychrobacter sp.]
MHTIHFSPLSFVRQPLAVALMSLLSQASLFSVGTIAAISLTSVSAHAELTMDNTEQQIRRIVQPKSNSQIQRLSEPVRAYDVSSNDLNEALTTYVFGSTASRSSVNGQSASKGVYGDSMQGLIEQKQRELGSLPSGVAIEERTKISRSRSAYNTPNNTYNSPSYNTGVNVVNFNFKTWLNADPYRAKQVADYQRYLGAQVGAYNVPPMDQLLTTARSWEDCGFEPYQLPPQYLWQNMVPTLKLYSALKQQGVLPPSTEIRSVYRGSALNQCAGGADASKHLSNGAMDIWIPEYEGNLWRIGALQDSLCEFWLYQGQAYNFGLGLYGTGSVHIDTQGYRKWGSNHSSSSSPCRF